MIQVESTTKKNLIFKSHILLWSISSNLSPPTFTCTKMLRWAGQVPANSALLPLAICGKRCIGRKRLWISKRIHHLSYKWGFTALSSYSSFREGMYKDAGAGFLPLDVASSYVPLCRHWQLLFRGFGWFFSDEMIKGIDKFSPSSACHLLSATSSFLS